MNYLFLFSVYSFFWSVWIMSFNSCKSERWRGPRTFFLPEYRLFGGNNCIHSPNLNTHLLVKYIFTKYWRVVSLLTITWSLDKIMKTAEYFCYPWRLSRWVNFRIELSFLKKNVKVKINLAQILFRIFRGFVWYPLSNLPKSTKKKSSMFSICQAINWLLSNK